MNKTFKVIFSKARNSYIVVNEATRSVQTKGTKMVIAGAVAALFAGSSWAADTVQNAAVSFDGSQLIINSSEEATIDASYKNNVITINEISGWKQSNQGAFNNLYHGETGVETVAASSVNIQAGENGGVIADNQGNNRGGAMTLWQADTGAEAATVHSVSGITFQKNTAVNEGGAIALQPWSNLTQSQKTTAKFSNNRFIENSANKGGAAFMENGVADFTDSVFTSNVAEFGGAIYVNKTSALTVSGSEFTGNKTSGSKANGGAIFVLNGDAAISESVFSKNESAKNGGAIAFSNDNQAEGQETEQQLSITGTQFIENQATGKGGAIFWYNFETNDREGALKIDDSEFASNTSKLGGAIYAESDMNVKGTVFNGNKATGEGGAIYVYKETTTLGNVAFSENTSGVAGGALYITEDATVNIKDVAFANNMVDDAYNDIHNDGQLNASGEITLDGGITGDGRMTVAKDTVLTVIAGKTTISNDVENQGASLNLIFDKGFDGNYQLITEEGSLDKAFTLVDNALYDISEKKDAEGNIVEGEYVIEKRSAQGIASRSGANANQARALLAVTEGSQASGNSTFDNIANFVNNQIQSNNESDRQSALDAVTALSTEAAPMIAQTETDAATQIYSAIGARFDTVGNQEPDSNLWVQGLFSTGDYDDNGSAKGYDTDSNGIAFGLDSAVTDAFRVGIGFAYTDTDIDGFSRDTDVETKTAFIYGQYMPGKWYVNGIMSYGWSSYEEAKQVAGYNVGADYDVNTFGLQAMAGCNLDVAGVGVSPEVGLRYFRLSQDGYTDGAGSTVGSEDNDVLTAVIGAKANKVWQASPSVLIKPQARVAVTYDLVDADNNAVITLANGASYRVEGETMDRFGVEVDLGVSAEISDNFEFALTYSGNFRGDFNNHAGLINAKYKF